MNQRKGLQIFFSAFKSLSLLALFHCITDTKWASHTMQVYFNLSGFYLPYILGIESWNNQMLGYKSNLFVYDWNNGILRVQIIL